MHLPATITGSFQGSAAVFQSSLKGLVVLLLIVSILVIYIILGILYESFIHPLTILSGLPSAGFGALITLMLFSLDLNIYGFVGLIMLVGIVKKNAIMMIDFAIEAQHERQNRRRRDLRRLPAAVPADHDDHDVRAHGHAAHRARPRRGRRIAPALGLAVVGGLVVSQCLTLYITPVVYLYLERFSEWTTRQRGNKNLPAKAGNQSGDGVNDFTRFPAGLCRR